MPVVTMIAGPNGSGKSTLKTILEAQGADFGVWLNADELARQLTGPQEQRERAAQLQIRAARDAAMAAGQDYCFETVMSHPSHVDHLLAVKAAGYETHLIYVCTDDPRININRVGDRVAEGGHAVPVPKIVKRHAGSIAKSSCCRRSQRPRLAV